MLNHLTLHRLNISSLEIYNGLFLSSILLFFVLFFLCKIFLLCFHNFKIRMQWFMSVSFIPLYQTQIQAIKMGENRWKFIQVRVWFKCIWFLDETGNKQIKLEAPYSTQNNRIFLQRSPFIQGNLFIAILSLHSWTSCLMNVKQDNVSACCQRLPHVSLKPSRK